MSANKKPSIYLTPYFACNVLLASAYFLLKATPLQNFMPWAEPMPALAARDQEILLFLACIVAVKVRKTQNEYEIIATAFLFAKCTNAVLFWRLNIVAFVLYLVAWLVAFLVADMPLFTGPTNVQTLSPMIFQNWIKADKTKLGTKSQFIMLKLYAAQSPVCQYLAPEFANLSMKYGSAFFRFAKIDVLRHPDVAKLYGIDTHYSSQQVPTFILFKDGVEVDRRPQVDKHNRVVKCRINAMFLETEFKLAEITNSNKKED
eukprot:m.36936 g.36936  ORF g.36936 m.36936 type:complete len:260 (+) comp9205_c0_seq1:42-821(+)